MNKRIAIGLAVMAMAVTAVQAATMKSLPAGGDWSATTTWSGGVVPGTVVGGADVVSIGTNSTVTLTTSVAQPLGNVQVGQGGAGALTINTGGSFGNGVKDINVGQNNVGTFIMNGGNVTNGGNFNVAGAVTTTAGSTATINGGTMTNKAINIGQSATGSLSVTGGWLLGSSLTVGDAGKGTFTMNTVNGGGSVINGGAFIIANTATAAGSTATISGGTITNKAITVGKAAAGSLSVTGGTLFGSSLTVGDAGKGTFTLSGAGSVTNAASFVIANALGSAGSTATISGGTMKNGAVTVGKGANGSLSMTGGNLLASSLSLGDTNNLFDGSAVLTGGTMELSSGNSLTINTASTLTIGDTGVLIWDGNRVADIGNLVAVNDIIWSSGSSTLGLTYGLGDQTWANGEYFLHADYDATSLKTTVWADTIPEPATIGMLGLGALITLLFRRLGVS